MRGPGPLSVGRAGRSGPSGEAATTGPQHPKLHGASDRVNGDGIARPLLPPSRRGDHGRIGGLQRGGKTADAAAEDMRPADCFESR